MHPEESITVPRVDLEAGRGLVGRGRRRRELQALEGEVVEERARVLDCVIGCVGCCPPSIWYADQSVTTAPCSPLAMCRRVMLKSELLSLGSGRVD